MRLVALYYSNQARHISSFGFFMTAAPESNHNIVAYFCLLTRISYKWYLVTNGMIRMALIVDLKSHNELN